jgi:hypothetical protein
VTAGYAAWRLAAARGEDVDYYVRLLKLGFLIGFIMLMIQPVSGLLYARAINASAPEAYKQLIQGPYQPWIYVQFLLIGALFLCSHGWLHLVSSRGRSGRWSLVATGSFALAMVLSVGYPDLRRVWTFALVALSAVVLYRARSFLTDGAPLERYQKPFIRFLSTVLAVVAVMTYLTMGTIRETARRPDTVRKVISLHDEARQPGAFRPGSEDRPNHQPPQTEHRP